MRRPTRATRAAVFAAAILTVALVAAIAASAASANGVALKKGDVLGDVGGGIIKHFDSTGKLLDELNTTTGTSEGDGMCFGAEGDLYATQGFQANTMSTFDSGGNLVAANFGSGYNEHPESCVFNAANDIFVGQPDGSKEVLEFNTKGEKLASFAPEPESRGTDWLDLAPDQCTLEYTSEGSALKAYDVCTKKQLANVASTLPRPCFAHRILADGSDLVACGGFSQGNPAAVEHLNAKGEIIKTYEPEPSGSLFALNLDPDGETFWTADYFTGTIYRINISTGAVVTTFSAAPLNGVLGGLSVVGERVCSEAQIKLAPATAENPVGSKHTLTATVAECGKAVSGATVTFTVTGPNAQVGTGVTEAGGEATFTYEGKNSGTDHIVASFVNKKGETKKSNEATKIWTKPKVEKRPTTTTTSLSGEGKSGESITVKEGTAVTDQATLTGANASKAGGKVTYKLYSDEACSALVKEAGTVTVSGGVVPPSEAETLAPGTYYWQASYGGDEANEESHSKCGSEVLKVESKPREGKCGKTTVGKSSDQLVAGQKRVNACVLPVNATVTELVEYLAPTNHSGKQVIKGVIYADSKGKPTTLLATSTQLTFTSKNSAGWYSLPFPGGVKLTAGNYWIGIITGNTTRVAGERYDSVANAEDYNNNSYTSGPSNPFGSFKTTNEEMSLYANWTAT